MDSTQNPKNSDDTSSPAQRHLQTSNQSSSRTGANRATVSRRSFLAAGTGVAATALAGCVGDSGPETFTIGAIHPLSGDAGEIGERMQNVMNAGVQAVNEGADLGPLVGTEGEGLENHDGIEVEIEWRDHRGDAGQGRSEAETLVLDEGVDVLCGSYFSGVTDTAAGVADREGVPFVCGTAISASLTELGYDWFWQVPPHNDKKAESMFQFLDEFNEEQDESLQRVAIIHEDSTFGTDAAGYMEDRAEEFGFEVVMGPIAYSESDISSFSSEISQMQSEDVEVLVPASNLRSANILLGDMQTAGWYPELFLTNGSAYVDPSFLEDAELSDHIFSSIEYADDMFEIYPEIDEYNQYAIEHGGTSFDGSSLLGWGELFTIIGAANNAESLSSDDLKDSLDSLRLEPMEGGMPYPVEFNESGYNDESFSSIIQNNDSEMELVWPFEDAQDGTLTWPVPGWDER